MSGDGLCHWHSVGFVESDDGWSCPMCPRPPDVDQLQADFAAARAEVERLRAAGDALAEVADEWPELVEAWQRARK